MSKIYDTIVNDELTFFSHRSVYSARMSIRWITFFLALFVAVSANAVDPALPDGLSRHRLSLQAQPIDHVNYLVYVPTEAAQRPAAGWPLIVFLHGSEQRGDDPRRLDDLPILSFILKDSAFPFVTIVPQCPAGFQWPPTVVKALLDEVERTVHADLNRIYLTGFSMGGYGTWRTAAAFPDVFAAIAPLCGLSDLPDTPILATIPSWVFHGARDRNVPLSESLAMTEALRRAGGDARLTVYPELDHDCWTMTYADSRLYLWFLAHSLSDESRIAASSFSGEALLDR